MQFEAFARIRALETAIKKAHNDLCKCTTVTYMPDDATAMDRALDKICDGVSVVVQDLRSVMPQSEREVCKERRNER